MSRSRAGCATCKKRHRKCDETRPVCLACKAQGLKCDGYDVILRWGAGIASRGQFAGASSPVARGSGSPRRPPTLGPADTSTTPPMAGPSNSGPGRPSTQAPAVARNPLPLPQRTVVEQNEDDRILREFSRGTVYYLYSTHRDDPFPVHLCQLAQECEALRAIIAAMHLYLTNPANPGRRFEEYTSRGILLFRQQLDLFDGSLDAGIFCTGLLICTMNLFQGIPWCSLLQHMMNVWELPRNAMGPHDQLRHPAVDVVLEAIAVMDLPTFVRGRATRNFGIWAQMRASRASDSGGERAGGVETMTGLPRTLLDIFATIEEDSSEQAFLVWPGEVGEVPFCHLWEAYRLAGVLVGRRLRESIRQPPGGGCGTPAGPPSPAADVLVGRLVAALDALCEVSGRPSYSNALAVNSILYPYAAARLEVAVLRQHVHWLDILRRVKGTCQPYGATENARVAEAMLDEAYDTADDVYDIDEQARKREVETAMF